MKFGSHRTISTLLSAAVAIALSSCSGAHHAVLPSTTRGTSPSASVAFTMHWPSARNANRGTASAVHRPQFVSPKTQSVVIEVNNDSTLTTIANKPAQGNVSTVSINAPVGSDEFTITTWDQPGGSGNELGQITVTQSVVAGKLNTVNATVDGVVEKLGMSAAPNGFVESSQDQNGTPAFTLVGTVAQTFTVVPEDVDGDVIVPPGNAPTLAMTSTDPSITVAPVSGKSNEYTVTPAFQTFYGTSVFLKVNGTDGVGNTITQQFSVNQSAAIYVSYANANGASPIVAYDEAGKAIATSGKFSELGNASAITWDSKRNRLVVADSALGRLTAFDIQGNVDSKFPQVPLDGASGVQYVPELDRIYVIQGSKQSISAFNGDGTPAGLAAGSFSGLTNPSSIAYFPNLQGFSPGPQLFVADNESTATVQVPAFNADGSAGTQSFQYQGSDGFFAAAIAYDLYVNKVFVVGYAQTGNGLSPVLREFDPDTDGSPDITATNGLNQPAGIAFNPVNHEIYIANAGDNSVSVFKDETGSTSFNQDSGAQFLPPNGQTNPTGITVVF